MKQTIGHIEVDGKKTLVLLRTKRFSRQLKLRKSGQDGIWLSDEEIHLRANPAIFHRLLAGEVIEA